MAQPQHQMPAARTYSSGQISPPPASPHPSFPTVPPNKRPRLSTDTQPLPGPQASPPFSPSSFSPAYASPGSVLSPSTAPSPTQPNLAMAGNAPSFNAPYPNGNINLQMPGSHQHVPSPLHTPPITSTPQTPSAPYPVYSNGMLAPIPVPSTPSVMGPPSKPADRPVREYQYDVDDSLAGTGIDLRQEEQFQADYFAGTFKPEARTGFPANPPGSRASFYGTGFANQPPQPTDAVDQTGLELEAAKNAWNKAAKNLAIERSQEIRNPFLHIHALHARADKIAKEHGIGLNLDQKHGLGMGKFRPDYDFPKPRVIVTTKRGPDGALVSTTGSFIPEDSFLVDQIALLSIATKHRLRELIEDAHKMAVTRQRTSHGVVPEEWVDAAAPLSSGEAEVGQDGSPRPGNESAVSPRTNPLKRPAETTSQDPGTEKVVQITTTNHLTQTLREVGKGDRNSEEARLRKRQKREEGKMEPGSASRSGSAAPATPGTVAPDPEKGLTKKELKSKTAAAKLAEQNTAASANRTMQTFFGKKRKQYSWMSQPASGTSTPTRPGGTTQGTPGTPGASQGARPAESQSLTIEGRNRLGAWREDGEKGKQIQLRDWVIALEAEDVAITALQDAYDKLDGSQPR